MSEVRLWRFWRSVPFEGRPVGMPWEFGGPVRRMCQVTVASGKVQPGVVTGKTTGRAGVSEVAGMTKPISRSWR